MLEVSLNYRDFLRKTLISKVEQNPLYSLRSFARSLGVAPSMLSEVLRGNKNFSHATALKVGQKLGLSEEEQELFCLMVQVQSAKTEALRSSLLKKINLIITQDQPRDLNADLFKMISDWYHLPILELTRIADSNDSPHRIAQKLGISSVEAQAAIDRLLRLELIEKDSQGKYKKTDNRLLVSSKIPHAALQRFHAQMLEKAINSLSEQSPQEKVVASETFAFDENMLEEARKITDQYLDRMSALSSKVKTPKDVYHVGVQFFRLTHPTQRKKNENS